MNRRPEAVMVAGHICLDITPALAGPLPGPGALHEVGEAALSLGGAVSNVGSALHRLGHPVRLVGAVGEDGFGRLVRDRLHGMGRKLDEYLQARSDAPTSYSVVLSPPGLDRGFLHCPGVNHAFDPADVTDSMLEGVTLLHFGYPPLMRRVWSDGGAALADLFERAHSRSIATSLDLAMPDSDGASGGVDWPAFFARVLPHVDLFLPSIDEIRATLGLPVRPLRDESDLHDVSARLISLGARVVVLKLGERGLYLRTAASGTARLPEEWRNREVLARCMRVEVQGTNGAGDSTIAGFLSAYLAGRSPLEAARWATAVGASSVESPLGAGGVRDAQTLARRLREGWTCREDAGPAGWGEPDDQYGILIGPRDATQADPAWA